MATAEQIGGTVAPQDFTNPLQAQAEGLARKRAIAQALMQQSLEGNPGQMVSGHYVGATPATTIGRILQAYLANKGLNKVSTQQQGLYGQYQAGVQDSLQKFLSLQQTNPRMALQYGMVSPYPQIQQMAKTFAEKLPGGAEVAPLTNDHTEASVSKFFQSGDPSVLVPKQKVTTINDQAVATGTDAAGNATANKIPGADLRDRFGPISQITPTTVGQVSDTGKANYAPRGEFINVSNMPSNVTAGAVGKESAESLFKQQTEALAAQKRLQTLQGAREIAGDPSSFYNGPTATAMNYWAGVLRTVDPTAAAKMDTDKKLQTTAAYRAAALTAAAQTGREAVGAKGENQYEQKILQDVGGGQINTPGPALQAALDVAIGRTANEINQYNNQLDFVRNAPPNADPQSVTHSMQEALPLLNTVPRVNLDPSKYLQSHDGLYVYKPPSGVPSAPATPAAPPPGLNLPHGWKYVGPAPAKIPAPPPTIAAPPAPAPQPPISEDPNPLPIPALPPANAAPTPGGSGPLLSPESQVPPLPASAIAPTGLPPIAPDGTIANVPPGIIPPITQPIPPR